MNNKKEKKSDLIEKIIRDEQESASRVIPEDILRSRLKERLKKESERAFHPNKRWLKRFAILGVISTIVFVGIIILIIFQNRRFQEIPTVSIRKVMENTPGIQNLAQMNLKSQRITSEKVKIAKGFQKKMEEIMKKYIKSYPSADFKKTPSLELKMTPHLDYSQKIEILLNKKAVHKFLQIYLKKNKEEKNG